MKLNNDWFYRFNIAPIYSKDVWFTAGRPDETMLARKSEGKQNYYCDDSRKGCWNIKKKTEWIVKG